MEPNQSMLDAIIEFAKRDERIRAVTMNGSRANSNCVRDSLSDYDIQYIVSDIGSFLSNREWIKTFGDVLIMQEPDNWHNHQYEQGKKEPYAFLMQFADGNRIDLTLVDLKNMRRFDNENEPRKVLLMKDDGLNLKNIDKSDIYRIDLPSEKEFGDIINEFFWLSTYVAKGIIRKELCYAKSFMDHDEIDLICRMLSWKIRIDNGDSVYLGKAYKYLKRYLSETEMSAFALLYANGEYPEIMQKLLYSLEYFKTISTYVAKRMHYYVDIDQMNNVKEYIEKLRLTMAST